MASGRIEFNIVLFMDWSFASGCSPPRLSDDAVTFRYGQDQCSRPIGTFTLLLCVLSGALLMSGTRSRSPRYWRCWPRRSYSYSAPSG